MNAVRALFGDGNIDGQWVDQHAGWLALGWPLLLTAVFMAASVLRY